MELVEKWRGDTDAGESKSVGSHTSGHFNPGKGVRASVQCQKTLTACTKSPFFQSVLLLPAGPGEPLALVLLYL